MGLKALAETLPLWARDIRVNVENLTGSPSALDEARRFSTLLAAAAAARNPIVVREVEEEARLHLSSRVLEAVYGTASVMGMNNVYYRAKHLLAQAGVTEYEGMSPRLRMQALRASGDVARADIELWALAASAVNGCGSCLAGHERSLRQEGVSEEAVHEALRVAAVINAAAAVLDAVDAAGPARPRPG